MYRTLTHLRSAIRASLEKSTIRSIYAESLNACWPDMPDKMRAEKIAQFGAENQWSVSLRSAGNLGLVAEFSKAPGDDHPPAKT